jgi:type I restriction enzyme S subunit
MNIDILQQHAEKLVRTPADVAKLRQLILSLAVQGKLVVGEEEQLGNAQHQSSTFQEKRLGDIADVIRGVTFPKEQSNDSPKLGYKALVRANNIGRALDLSELIYVNQEFMDEVQFIRKFDILVALSSGSKNLVGKAVLVQDELEASIGGFCGIIRNKSANNPIYLGYFFQSPQYRKQVAALGKGIGISNLSKSDLVNILIPLPTLSEQERIVARVDELMGWCDALEAQLRQRAELRQRVVQAALAEVQRVPSMQAFAALLDPRIGASAAELRQMILSLAVQGKLVAQNEDDEPAYELLNSIDKSAEKALRYGERVAKPVYSEHRIPNWVQTSLGNFLMLGTVLTIHQSTQQLAIH